MVVGFGLGMVVYIVVSWKDMAEGMGYVMQQPHIVGIGMGFDGKDFGGKG